MSQVSPGVEEVAIVSGDVIASSALTMVEREHLPGSMREAYEEGRSVWPDLLPYPLAIVGGDGWQFLVNSPGYALCLTLYYRAALQSATGVRTRAAIAIDTIDFIKEDRLNESDGAAFRRSGPALEALDPPTTMVCLLPETVAPVYQLAVDALASYADHVARQWTRAQAQAVAAALMGAGRDRKATQEAIAAAWKPEPITQQAVNKHLQKAHWGEVEDIVTDFDRLLQLWHAEPHEHSA